METNGVGCDCGTSKRNETFYWDTAVFQVEDVLYKIPKYQLVKEPESAFAVMFTLPQEPPLEGLNDENPIKLGDVSKVDWEHFLEALYPSSPFPDKSQTTIEAWISILRLSTKWCFNDLRRTAISAMKPILSEFDLLKMLVLGEELQIPDWISYGCQELALRMEPLSLSEAEQLSLQHVIIIGQLREYATLVAFNALQSVYYFPHHSDGELEHIRTYSGSFQSVARHYVEQRINQLNLGSASRTEHVIFVRP